MLHRQRLLESENHTGHDVGDCPNYMRRDVEDALVQALEDTHRDGRLNAIRDWVRRWGVQCGLLTHSLRDILLASDADAWQFAHVATCSNYRMLPRWEHSANRLMREYGFAPQQIPAGKEALHL